MATVAASLAVGVGVSLSRAARERRSKRDRRLGLQGTEPLNKGLQRMALGQLDIALEMLDDGREIPDEKAVHETRKALKRLRALLRLLRAELGEDAYGRETAAVRDAGHALAGARDAEVMLATLDALIARHRRDLAGRGGVIELRGALLAERTRARQQSLGDPRTRTQVVAELRACRVRVSCWQLPEGDGVALVEAGLLRLYRQGRKRRRRAKRGKGERMRTMHEWRKRVKDLRYAAEMLAPPERPKSGRPKRKRARRRYESARKDAAWLRQQAQSADELGEVLGEDHDLAVLAQRADQARLGKRSRKKLLKLIARRRRKLRGRALRKGDRLYGPAPRKFMRRVRGAHGER